MENKVFNQICQITINGYRSIREADFTLTPFTVLVGANGAGKSNFLDFFRMLNNIASMSMGNLQTFVARSGRASSLLYYGPQVTQRINSSIVLYNGMRYEFTLEWGSPDNLFYERETLSDILEKGKEPLVLSSDRQRESAMHLASRSDEVIDTFMYIFDHLRTFHFHDTTTTAPVRVSQDTTGEVLLTSNASNLAVFLNYIKAEKPSHFQRILSTVKLVAPFIKDLEVTPDTVDERHVMLKWRDMSDKVFGPHQLSDGTIRAIALITALLQPEEWMPSIMIFDEPELGLHPAAVGLVAGLLKAASLKRQVIVATQSPILIEEYQPEDIIVLERHEDESGQGESRFKRLDKAALGHWIERFSLGQLYVMNVTGGGPQ